MLKTFYDPRGTGRIKCAFKRNGVGFLAKINVEKILRMIGKIFEIFKNRVKMRGG